MKKKGQQSQDESIEDGFIEYGEEDDEISDRDERPESVDDKVRQKEMRKGMDLATTLERIEKNFVITDPRLPDNPIVRNVRIKRAKAKIKKNTFSSFSLHVLKEFHLLWSSVSRFLRLIVSWSSRNIAVKKFLAETAGTTLT